MYNRPSREQYEQFRSDWGMSLSKFWHPITGFDIVGWDDWCVPDDLPDGISAKKWVEQEKGKAAVTLILDLIAGRTNGKGGRE